MDKQYTITEIARHFSLAESTARYYCKRFLSFMPITGEGRRKRYGEKSLEIIAFIIDHMKQGKTAVLVEEELNAHFPRVMDVNVEKCYSNANPNSETKLSQENSHEIPSSHNSLELQTHALDMNSAHPAYHNNHQGTQHVMQLLEQQTIAMQSIASSLAVLATQKEDLQRLEDAARMSKEENTLLREEVHVLQTLLDSSDKVHQYDLNKIRDWISRLAQNYNEREPMKPMDENKN